MEEFLIGGKTNVVAIHERLNKITGQLDELKEHLAPGELLKGCHVVARKRTTFFRSSQERYLKCTNISGREYLIPLTATGSFYPVLASGKRTLFQISHLVQEGVIPCNVQLVYGRGPDTPCIFNSNLRLLSYFEEKSIVASTIFNQKNILVEINVNMPMNFVVADTTPELVSSVKYQNALNLCQRMGKSFSRGIKIMSTWHATQAGNADYGRIGLSGAGGNDAAGNDRRGEEHQGIPIESGLRRHSGMSTSTLVKIKLDTYATGSLNTFDPRSRRGSDRSRSLGTDTRPRSQSIRKIFSKFTSRVGLSLSSSVPTEIIKSIEDEPIYCTSIVKYPNCARAADNSRFHSKSEDEKVDIELEKDHEKTPPIDIVNGPVIDMKKSERGNSTEKTIHFRQEFSSVPHCYENVTEQKQPESESGTQNACGYDSACAKFNNDWSNPSADDYDYLPCMMPDSGDHYVTMTPPQHNELNVYQENEEENTANSSDSESEHIYDTPDVTSDIDHYLQDADELPIGSSCTLSGYRLWNNRDSGYTGSSDPLSLTSLSVTEVSDALRARMVNENTIEALQRAGVDGILLMNMDETTLREVAPGITGLEVIKITLYIKKGWNLNR